MELVFSALKACPEGLTKDFERIIPFQGRKSLWQQRGILGVLRFLFLSHLYFFFPWVLSPLSSLKTLCSDPQEERPWNGV